MVERTVDEVKWGFCLKGLVGEVGWSGFYAGFGGMVAIFFMFSLLELEPELELEADD